MRSMPTASWIGFNATHHLDRGTVRIGDDVTVAVFTEPVQVDFRHDQRDVLVTAELRGVVDHHAAGRRRPGREFGRHVPAGGKQPDPGLFEIEGIQALDGHGPALKPVALALGAFARQQEQAVDRETALPENLEHCLAYSPRGAGDGHVYGSGTHPDSSSTRVSSASSASPMARVPTGSMPFEAGAAMAMSAVRSPLASTCSTAVSIARAASGASRL